MSKIADALKKIQDNRLDAGSHSVSKNRKIGRIDKHSNANMDQPDDTEVLSTGNQSSRFVHIDSEAMREAGLIAPKFEAKLFEDEYRVIKRPILSNAYGRNSSTVDDGHVVLVTSAVAGDGKTFTCINLALSLAREQDSSVLLVDADLPKPHISQLFDAQDEVGLLDFLNGSTRSINEIELKTSVDGLTVIPAGTARDHSTELLSGQRMEEFLELVHRRDPNQIILIDSSPLLQTTEARALAAVSGQIVLIVRAGVTPKDAVREAIAVLDTHKPVNTVLNQVNFNRGSSYYEGYGAGYGGNND